MSGLVRVSDIIHTVRIVDAVVVVAVEKEGGFCVCRCEVIRDGTEVGVGTVVLEVEMGDRREETDGKSDERGGRQYMSKREYVARTKFKNVECARNKTIPMVET
jgi:hypothetical protein